MKNEVFTR